MKQEGSYISCPIQPFTNILNILRAATCKYVLEFLKNVY